MPGGVSSDTPCLVKKGKLEKVLEKKSEEKGRVFLARAKRGAGRDREETSFTAAFRRWDR